MGQDLLVHLLAATRSALSAAPRAAPLCTVATVLLCLCAQRVSGQDRLEREGQIKAAMILNIARLVTWPADGATDATELTVCVLDDPQFAIALGTIETAVVQGRPVAVTEIPGPSDAEGCQIVFIGAAGVARLEEVLAALPAGPILTVGDTPRFAERGGTIGFTTQRNRVQLELNLQSAEASGLPVSSQLIRLATIVREPAGSGST